MNVFFPEANSLYVSYVACAYGEIWNMTVEWVLTLMRISVLRVAHECFWGWILFSLSWTCRYVFHNERDFLSCAHQSQQKVLFVATNFNDFETFCNKVCFFLRRKSSGKLCGASGGSSSSSWCWIHNSVFFVFTVHFQLVGYANTFCFVWYCHCSCSIDWTMSDCCKPFV